MNTIETVFEYASDYIQGWQQACRHYGSTLSDNVLTLSFSHYEHIDLDVKAIQDLLVLYFAD